MKTHVIQLDQHDDQSSIRDKICWAKSKRILLVFPTDRPTLIKKLDFLLIKRQAEAMGAQVAIVSRVHEIKNTCIGLEIPVFNGVSEANRRWVGIPKRGDVIQKRKRMDPKEIRNVLIAHNNIPSPSFPRQLLIFSVGLAGIVIIFVAFIPKATILLTPRQITQTVTVGVYAEILTGNDPLTGLSSDAYPVVNTSGSLAGGVTGYMMVPEKYAVGEVYFTNLSDVSITVPEGTIVGTVSDPPIRFSTLASVEVPAAGASVDRQRSKVQVQAVLPGEDGNIPPGAIIAIEGSYGIGLSVNNTEEFSGGGMAVYPGANAEDRALLWETLLEKLTEDCYQGLMAKLLLEGTAIPYSLGVQIVHESYFPPIGQPGEIFSLTMEITCTGLDTISSATSETETSVEIIDGFSSLGDISIASHGKHIEEEGFNQWEMRAQQTLIAQVNRASIIHTILGLGVQEARDRLSESLLLDITPVIKVTPDWWPWMPIVPLRVEILQPEQK